MAYKVEVEWENPIPYSELMDKHVSYLSEHKGLYFIYKDNLPYYLGKAVNNFYTRLLAHRKDQYCYVMKDKTVQLGYLHISGGTVKEPIYKEIVGDVESVFIYDLARTMEANGYHLKQSSSTKSVPKLWTNYEIINYNTPMGLKNRYKV